MTLPGTPATPPTACPVCGRGDGHHDQVQWKRRTVWAVALNPFSYAYVGMVTSLFVGGKVADVVDVVIERVIGGRR